MPDFVNFSLGPSRSACGRPNLDIHWPLSGIKSSPSPSQHIIKNVDHSLIKKFNERDLWKHFQNKTISISSTSIAQVVHCMSDSGKPYSIYKGKICPPGWRAFQFQNKNVIHQVVHIFLGWLVFVNDVTLCTRPSQTLYSNSTFCKHGLPTSLPLVAMPA